MRRFPLLLAAALLLAGAAHAEDFVDGPETAGQHPARPDQTRAPAPPVHSAYRVSTVASGLSHPWGLAWLPDGRMLVTERPGRLRVVTKDGALSAPVAGVPEVTNEDNGGLLDIAVDPAFAANHLVYFTYLEPRGAGDMNGISIGRGRLDETGGAPALRDVTVLLRTQPAVKGAVNVGSRLTFGPDGLIYATIGDRMSARALAQSPGSDLGKVVRLAPDGSIPRGNPFAGRPGALPEVFSLGHRNPLGLAFQPGSGKLWEHENGARGGDELNLVRKGRNYGWPVIAYGVDYDGSKLGTGTATPGLEQPVYFWDPSIAPSGMTFYDGALFPDWKGDLFVGALKAKRVLRLRLRGERVVFQETLLTELGERIRDVRQGPDGALYLLTDNDAGRILRVTPPEG